MFHWVASRPVPFIYRGPDVQGDKAKSKTLLVGSGRPFMPFGWRLVGGRGRLPALPFNSFGTAVTRTPHAILITGWFAPWTRLGSTPQQATKHKIVQAYHAQTKRARGTEPQKTHNTPMYKQQFHDRTLGAPQAASTVEATCQIGRLPKYCTCHFLPKISWWWLVFRRFTGWKWTRPVSD